MSRRNFHDKIGILGRNPHTAVRVVRLFTALGRSRYCGLSSNMEGGHDWRHTSQGRTSLIRGGQMSGGTVSLRVWRDPALRSNHIDSGP